LFAVLLCGPPSFETPAGLTKPGTSIIVAEITYNFEPLGLAAEVYSPGSVTMTRRVIVAPRKSSAVTNASGNGCPP